MAATTWDPNARAAGITLFGGPVQLIAGNNTISNSNLTFTASTSSWLSNRANASSTSGKVYFELTTNAGTTTPSGTNANLAVAVLDGSANLGSWLGQDAHAVGFFNDNRVLSGGVSAGTWFGAGPNKVIGIALDYTAKLAWAVNVTDAPTNWNGSTLNSPAAGTGGIAFNATMASPFLVGISAITVGGTASGTLNFGATGYTGTAPTGFGNIPAFSYGSNLGASAASGTNPGVFATRTLVSPLIYYEITASALTSTFAIGFANRAWNDASGTLLGGDANGVGFRQDGTVKLNNVTLATIFTYTQADIIQVAQRLADRTVFFKKNNAGNWNNTGGADPTTNTGGIDYSSMSFGVLFPAFGAAIVSPNQLAIAAFSSADWAYSAPTGFLSPDAAAPVTVPELPKTTPNLDGPVRTDAVTTTVQKTGFPIAAGAWYGISANRPGTATRVWSPAGPIKGVSGTISENNVAAAKRARLYDHNSGEFLGEVTSASGSGAYAIPALGRSTVYAVAFDDPNFNALVYDSVVPVTIALFGRTATRISARGRGVPNIGRRARGRASVRARADFTHVP